MVVSQGQKINALKCTSGLIQICNNDLPSQKEDEVHPSKEEGNGPGLMFDSKLTVTVWENINQGCNVTNPLQSVGQFKEIFDFLWYKEKKKILLKKHVEESLPFLCILYILINSSKTAQFSQSTDLHSQLKKLLNQVKWRNDHHPNLKTLSNLFI